MRDYETLVVLQPDYTEEQIKAFVERVKEIISAAGEILSVEEWGLRKLAYTIDKKYTDGYYILFNFKSDASVLPNLEHLYKITDAVIRDIIVNKEK